jgi:hypothetical protein
VQFSPIYAGGTMGTTMLSEEARGTEGTALELENGEMRYRARARDALETIEYFE